MSKYDNFRKVLTEEKENKVCYSFDELEKELGFPLPPYARKNRGFFSNDETHPQARDGWRKLGWEVGFLDMENQKVCFIKSSKKPDTSTNQVISMDFSVIDSSEKYYEKKASKKPDIKGNYIIYAPEKYDEINARLLRKVNDNVNKEIPKMTSAEFDNILRHVLSKYYKKDLFAGQIPGIPNLLPLVSEDKTIIGDTKYFAGGESLSTATILSVLGTMWLLEQVANAKHKFIVFGNNREVPVKWLKMYGEFLKNIEFFFYDTITNRLIEIKYKIGTNYPPIVFIDRNR